MSAWLTVLFSLVAASGVYGDCGILPNPCQKLGLKTYTRPCPYLRKECVAAQTQTNTLSKGPGIGPIPCYYEVLTNFTFECPPDQYTNVGLQVSGVDNVVIRDFAVSADTILYKFELRDLRLNSTLVISQGRTGLPALNYSTIYSPFYRSIVFTVEVQRYGSICYPISAYVDKPFPTNYVFLPKPDQPVSGPSRYPALPGGREYGASQGSRRKREVGSPAVFVADTIGNFNDLSTDIRDFGREEVCSWHDKRIKAVFKQVVQSWYSNENCPADPLGNFRYRNSNGQCV